MPVDLENELDRLYGADLDAFVAERGRLVRALRKEGRRAEAADVQELRKPWLTAWTVNQLCRRRRKDVDLLLDAGHRLAGAQHALLGGGDQAGFDEARGRQQATLNRLRQAAGSILGERASPAMLDRVVSTLRAASVAPAARPELARGRLTGELSLSGFEAFTGVEPSSPAKRKPKAARAKAAERSDQGRAAAARRAAVSKAQAELERAKERHTKLARQVRDADRSVETARRSLASAERDVERLRAEERAAAAAVDAARSRLEAARER